MLLRRFSRRICSAHKMIARNVYLSRLHRMKLRQRLLCFMLRTRYNTDRINLPSCTNWITFVLPNCPEHIFKHSRRMSRARFYKAVQLLEMSGTDTFTTGSTVPQTPVYIQLHLFMTKIGFYGNGAAVEQVRSRYGISVGLVNISVSRVTKVLFSMMSSVIRWPNAAQRKKLCRKA